MAFPICMPIEFKWWRIFGICVTATIDKTPGHLHTIYLTFWCIEVKSFSECNIRYATQAKQAMLCHLSCPRPLPHTSTSVCLGHVQSCFFSSLHIRYNRITIIIIPLHFNAIRTRKWFIQIRPAIVGVAREPLHGSGKIPNPFELKRAAVRKIGSVADNILFPLFFNGEDTATKNELRSQANILCCLRFSRKFECFSSGVFSFFLYFVFVNFLAHTHNNKFCIWQLSARRERHKVYVVRERKTVASTEKTIEVTCICSYTVWCVHCSVQSMPPPINSSRCDRLPVAAARCYLIYGSAGEKLWTYRPGKK